MRTTKTKKPSSQKTPRSLPDRGLDELMRANGDAVAAYTRLTQVMQALGPQYLWRLSDQAQQLMRDLGVTFNLYSEDARHDNIVPFDLFPRVIDAETWNTLYRGVQQRLKIWNALFKDIYGSQEVLKAGVLPFELVYDDPHYQRAAVGLTVLEDIFVHVAAFDLNRDKQGRWTVIDDYVSNTTGASYALQSRHVLSQVSPELLDLAEIRPVHGYPTELLEHLRRFARSTASEPRVVLLSPGVYNHAFYEHSYLARQMGIPLVRGNDLIVLNTRVYLKTIGGLEPIDVIYRRMDEAFIDPLAFREDSQLGVPGLMTCVRKGTVTIANAIGTGLGDNRTIAAFLPRLAKFYLNEPLQLPTVPRLLCYDRDQCEQVLGNMRGYLVMANAERSNQSVWHTADMGDTELEQLRLRIAATPGQFVAEPYLPLNYLPGIAAEGLTPHHAGLRLFAFGGAAEPVYPCAFTRYATQENSRIISSGLGGGIKDTWILRGAQESSVDSPIIVSSPQRRLRLGSRTADSLFWTGRYTERAENTARIFKVLQLVQREEKTTYTPQTWAPLWEALAYATGHPTNFFKRAKLHREQSVAHYILIDRQNHSSVMSCVERSRDNARAIRESLPPELWMAMNRLYQTLGEADIKKRISDLDQPEILDIEDLLLEQMDALSGTAARTMLRDDGWHFWSLGIHIERAITTLLVMRQVFLKRQDEKSKTPRRADNNLDALLRMLSCQYAYRSLFQSRPVLQNVAMMLVQDPQLPRSVFHCLTTIRQDLETIFGGSGQLLSEREAMTPVRRCARLIGEVEFTDLTPYFVDQPGAKSPRFRDWIDQLVDQLISLSTGISDHYLQHQAFNILK